MSKTPGPAPLYMLAGGPGSRHKDGDPIIKQVLANSGIPHPSVAYVGAASDDNRPFLLMLTGYLRLSGAGAVTLAPLAGKRVDLVKTRAILQAADIVYISGGDVEVGMKVLEERQILSFMRELYEGGKPFFGISAGSIMLGQQWVRWRNPDDDTTAELFPCMGFAPLACDTHGEGEGWEELRALLRLNAVGTEAYGIPSGSGLCIYPDGRMEALGTPVHRYAHQPDGVARGVDVPVRPTP